MDFKDIPSIDDVKLEKYLNYCLAYASDKIIECVKNGISPLDWNDIRTMLRNIERYCEKRNKF